MKNVLIRTLGSIAIATLIFCAMGVIFDIQYGGTFQMTDYAFTKMVIGCVVLGIGWGVPTVLYENENRSYAASGLLHILTGCVVMTIVSYAVGWIPSDKGVLPAVLSAALQIAIGLVIWFLIYRNQKSLAKKMNDRLRRMNEAE